MVPGAGLEPARPQWPGDFKSPVSTDFTTRASGYKSDLYGDQSKIGGAGRNRTGVHGVAVRCMTTLPPRLIVFKVQPNVQDRLFSYNKTQQSWVLKQTPQRRI